MCALSTTGSFLNSIYKIFFLLYKKHLMSAYRILLFTFLLSLPLAGWAKSLTGEIININPTDRVAFIDLGKDAVRSGDIFTVEGQSGKIYLEVLQASEAVSQLGASQNEDYKGLPGDFDALSIGQTVRRVFSLDPSSEAVPMATPAAEPARPQPVVPSPTPPDPAIASEVQRLRAELQALQGKAMELYTTNIELKKQLETATSLAAASSGDVHKYKKQAEDAQVKVELLKERLDHLSKLIENNLQ